ncbi:MAG: hypothetical protein A2W25_15255 [candidate division Zixibacteria bacterium RBG_16_53_22]|nr:MAG: hypothetical protein A2W25_15255 [candidate division Zixibacteria bacterium RBG_16_53_22]
MPSYALSDGVNVVNMEPDYDLVTSARKVQTMHRTRSGAAYLYKWGRFDHVAFGVTYLSSADMCRVNSWWGANTPVVLYDLNSVAVVSGYLINASTPVDRMIKPYTDLFMGLIELESF